MKTPTLLFALFLVFGTSFSVNAHDYWIAPQNYQPQVGQSVVVKLFVGDHFNEETERPLQQKMTVDFLLHSDATAPRNLIVAEQFTIKPVAQFVINKPGTHVISMQRNWAQIEMTGDKFHQYLEHEGLHHIIAQRKKAGEADKSATERYRRYLKSLLVVGGKRTSTWNKPLGHKLEIIPLSDPTVAKQNDTLQFRVLLDNNTLANVQLAALGRQADKVTDIHSTTDKNGVASLKLPHTGEWLVRLVYLRRCEQKNVNADWESFWAGLTFWVGS
ncbi:MAG: DUF4198 domain-containing protein [Pirellulaceae bacterium]